MPTPVRLQFGHAVLLVSALAAVSVAWTRRAREVPDWRAVSAAAFPERAAELLDAGLDDAACDELAAIMNGDDHETATRAAVLLGAVLERERNTARAPRIAALLLARLERREAVEVRGHLGADVVAARALDRRAFMDGVAERLLVLACGDAPHPVLAVRTECAAVVLEANVGFVDVSATNALAPIDVRREQLNRRAAAFLLSVLRAETPDEARSPRTWDRVTTLAWVKTRAAMALNHAAAVTPWNFADGAASPRDPADAPVPFRPDGSWAHQMAAADRLEAILLGD
jgi:hypothetical protein